MNERIKELAVQAELHLELQSLKVEKFAELIVRECAKVGKESVIRGFEVGVTTTYLQDYVEGKIKKHFGVE